MSFFKTKHTVAVATATPSAAQVRAVVDYWKVSEHQPAAVIASSQGVAKDVVYAIKTEMKALESECAAVMTKDGHTVKNALKDALTGEYPLLDTDKDLVDDTVDEVVAAASPGTTAAAQWTVYKGMYPKAAVIEVI